MHADSLWPESQSDQCPNGHSEWARRNYQRGDIQFGDKITVDSMIFIGFSIPMVRFTSTFPRFWREKANIVEKYLLQATKQSINILFHSLFHIPLLQSKITTKLKCIGLSNSFECSESPLVYVVRFSKFEIQNHRQRALSLPSTRVYLCASWRLSIEK